MNRKQKIIVSITGIFIVLLALVGLTYAYFLTQIKGNTNNKSISVTTAKLELVYGDGNGVLTPANLIEPGDDIQFLDAKGKLHDSKTFTVTNNGNATVNYGVYLENLINEFERIDDLLLTLTCTSKMPDGEEQTCNGASMSFPNYESLVTSNIIEPTETQTYTLKLKYLEMNVDQSIDMGKTLSAKIQIYDMTNLLKNENTLAYKIIDNVKNGTTSTTYRNVPLSIPAKESTTKQEQIVGDTSTVTLVDAQYYTYAANITFNELSGYSLVDPKVDTWAKIKADSSKLANFKYLRRETGVAVEPVDEAGNPTERTQLIKDMVRVDNISDSVMTYTMVEMQATNESAEQTLSAAKDNYGISYYFRGNVDDNYVTYNGMCFRIVRILGDGSVKLVLESTSECSSSMTSVYTIDKAFYGYKYDGSTGIYNIDYLNSDSSSDSLRTKLNAWLNDKSFDKSELKQGDWCLGNFDIAYSYSAPYNLLEQDTNTLVANGTNFFYESYARLYRFYPESATFICGDNELIADEDYIGTLTADEVVYAGHKLGAISTKYYLGEDETESAKPWFTLSPHYFKASEKLHRVFVVSTTGNSHVQNNARYYIRPSIILNNLMLYSSGDGTVDNAYKVVKSS